MQQVVSQLVFLLGEIPKRGERKGKGGGGYSQLLSLTSQEREDKRGAFGKLEDSRALLPCIWIYGRGERRGKRDRRRSEMMR